MFRGFCLFINGSNVYAIDDMCIITHLSLVIGVYLEGIHKTVNLCIWVSSNGNYKEKMLLFVC